MLALTFLVAATSVHGWELANWFDTLEKKHFLAGGAPCSTDGGVAPMAKGGPGKPLKMLEIYGIGRLVKAQPVDCVFTNRKHNLVAEKPALATFFWKLSLLAINLF